MNNYRFGASLLAVLALSLGSVRADVKLPAIFSDHMVLQQGAACAVWGWADPGERVTVTVAGKSQSALAGSDGRWQVALPKLKAGGPHTLVAKGKNILTVQDVLVGEVWLGSGQSNMGMTVDRCRDFEGEQAKADRPTLRMFTVPRHAISDPQKDCSGAWVVCAANTVGGFSAALYFHGREIQTVLKVPMGLINSSWGGTPIEAWTSAEAQAGPAFQAVREPWDKQLAQPWDEAKAEAAYKKAVASWKKAAAKARAEGKEAARAPQKPADPRFSQHRPANLFNGMIAPILPYTLSGVVWYQGENNAGKAFAHLYGLQLRTLIQDWRQRWQAELPFAWVQLPDFRVPQKEPSEPSGWVTVREQMLQTLAVPRTGMAITLGLGEEKDIHPKNKQDVGRRLAAWGLAEVYGRKVPWLGPVPAKHQVKGSEVAITFAHAEGGLKASGGELKGFAIAGADRKFVWANARIQGRKVVVWHPDVLVPAAVRYAWADNPVWTLVNGAGLPASPFRTDDWP